MPPTKPKKKTRQSPLHFRRIEIKYLIPDRLIPSFVDRISPYTNLDPYLISEGRGRTIYPVTSLYFDSLDLQSLHEKEAGLLSRRKVRLRAYEDIFSEGSDAFIEIKRRHDVVVSKDRLSLSFGSLDPGLPISALLEDLLTRVEASEEVTHEAHVLQSQYNLQPTTLVTYRRMPFVSKQDHRFRITIDHDLRGAWKPPNFLGDQFFSACHPGWSVVELKCNHAAPAWFHDALMDFNLQRTAHSKYVLCTEYLRGRLSNDDM